MQNEVQKEELLTYISSMREAVYQQDSHVFIGGFGRLHGQNSLGIERYGFQGVQHTLVYEGLAVALESPTWIERNGERIYAVLEDSDEIAALSIENDGEMVGLTLLSTVASSGKGPTHCAVAVDDLGAQHLLVANYTSGTIGVHPIGPDGSVSQATQVFEGEGSGPLPAQEGPHAHWILPLPDGRVLSTDLGADRIYVYRWDEGELQRVGFVAMPAGTGPRDLHLLPYCGKDLQSGSVSSDSTVHWAVAAVGEWSNTVTLLAADDSVGAEALRVIQTIPLGGAAQDQAASLVYVPKDVPGYVNSGNVTDHSGDLIGFAYIGLRGTNRIITLGYDGTRLVRLHDNDMSGSEYPVENAAENAANNAANNAAKETAHQVNTSLPENTSNWRISGVSSAGERPRQLNLVGNRLVAANEVSNSLAIFDLLESGKPELLATVPANSPTVILPL